jgi:hypothetical protein
LDEEGLVLKPDPLVPAPLYRKEGRDQVIRRNSARKNLLAFKTGSQFRFRKRTVGAVVDGRQSPKLAPK